MSKGYPNHREVEAYSRNGLPSFKYNTTGYYPQGNVANDDGDFGGEQREEDWLKIYNTYVSNLQDRSKGNSSVALPGHSPDLSSSSSSLSDASRTTNYFMSETQEDWLKIYNTYVSNLRDRSRGNSGIALPSHSSDLNSSILSDAGRTTNYSGPLNTSNRQYTGSKSAGQNRETESLEDDDDDDLEEREEDSTNNVTRFSDDKVKHVKGYLEYRGSIKRQNYVPLNNREGNEKPKGNAAAVYFHKKQPPRPYWHSWLSWIGFS